MKDDAEEKFAAKLKRYAEPRQIKLTERDRESVVAAACDDLARLMGFAVEKYEPGRVSKIQKGLSDRRYVHPWRGRIWVELKAPGGKMTLAQHAFCVTENNNGGLAAPIDDVATLRVLFQAMDGTSIGTANARNKCVDITRLCMLRGYRPS